MSNSPSDGRAALAAALIVLTTHAVADDWKAKVDASLWAKVAASREPVDVIITPVQPTARAIDLVALSQRTLPAERPRVIHGALRALAAQSQRDTMAWLARENISYRSFFVANAISARIPAERLAALAQQESTARIDPDTPVQLRATRPDLLEFRSAINAVEAGVSYINADDVWALPGNPRGQGVVIAGQDTGYRWTHAALKSHYRGWNGLSADHDYNWHDAIHSGGGACGVNTTQPCDDYGHGTHTMGTMVGDDGGGNQVGVAPEAKWIGCRNMDVGAGTPSTYLECLEFLLAPYPVGGTPAQGDPTKAPHVINNSWGCPTSEGCNSGNWATMQAAVDALNAAGVLVVASAGNDGSACSTVTSPPAMFATALTVGAFSAATGAIASFSSRGPVTVDASNRPKPDFSAPGVAVRSTLYTSDSSYGNNSGTSMASPHAAAAAALVMSAVPELRRQPQLVRQFLLQGATAVSVANACSSSGVPNNVYGSGRLDALAAVQAARTWQAASFLVDGFEDAAR